MSSDRGGSGRSGPPRKEGDRNAKNETRKRAERLVRDTGIPRALAFQVALGNLSLNDALQKLALRDKVESLISRHDLPRSLATQIAIGHADLDAALAKRRLQKHLDAHAHDSVLLEAREKQRTIVLAVHGGQFLKGKVDAVDKYEVEFTPAKGEPERIHKVRIRFAAWSEDFMKVRSQAKTDKRFAGEAEPIFRPQGRYGCSDRRLFRYMEDGTRIAVTVLEGDQFTGSVEWMSRWEFGLKLNRGVGAIIFRHALADVREV